MKEEKYEMIYPKGSEKSQKRSYLIPLVVLLGIECIGVVAIFFYFQPHALPVLEPVQVPVAEPIVATSTEPLTEAEKLEVLDSLKSSTVEVSEEKRRETLSSLSTQNSKESQMTKEEKIKILESL